MRNINDSRARSFTRSQLSVPLAASALLAWISVLDVAEVSAQQEIFNELPICDSNMGVAGGDDTAQVNTNNNTASLGVAVLAFESLNQSAFAELKRTFTPVISMPMTISYGPLNYFGELTGFGNIVEASVHVEVVLRDETAGVVIDSAVLLDESEDGAFATQIINQIDSGFSPPSTEFNGVQLVTGNTYSVTARMEVVADGLGAKADFTLQPVSFGCLVATSELVDSDGDGLFDDWEENGVDVDADGDIDVPLPAYGADPMHKDIFIEYDWVTGFAPSRNDIQNVKAAFAAAPVDAGGTANPDMSPGINFWIDTGTASDPLASEDGAGANSCGDGLDNGSDGFIDGADPDCLSGDNLGGGNAVAGPVTDLDNTFYFTKNHPAVQAFTPERRGLFRYGIQGDPADSPAGLGGRAERGGDDFVVYNRLPGSLFHEVGHSLNLSHGGGGGETNCKPSYVSVMNYQHQLGLFITGGTGGQDLDGDGTPDGQYLDFSPAQIPGGRGQAPLAPLDETDLDDGLILDPTDPVNQFAFVDPNGMLVRAPLNLPVDWNSDGDTMDLNQQIDVDIDGPSSCASNVGLTADPPGLTGYDDWSNIRLPILLEGDELDAPVNPVLEPEPNEEELFDLARQFNTTDMSIDKSDAPDPIEVGETLTYTLTVVNQGPNPGSRIIVTDTLPDNVSLVSMSPECIEVLSGEISCELGELLAWEQAQLEIQVDTSEVCENGVPPLLSNSASVSNEPKYAGTDPDPSDDDVTEDTVAQDTTPPVVDCNAPATIIPPDATISFTATAEDLCDDAPEVEITEFDCFTFTKKGKRIDKTKSCVVALVNDAIFIEDSGGVGDRIGWTARAEDGSGNVTEQDCEVEVVNPGRGN